MLRHPSCHFHPSIRLIHPDSLPPAPHRHPGEFVIADAAGVVAEALVQMSAIREGHPLLERVHRVRFWVGRHAEAHFRGGVIDVVVDPHSGLAGRPSSGRVAKVMVEASE